MNRSSCLNLAFNNTFQNSVFRGQNLLVVLVLASGVTLVAIVTNAVLFVSLTHSLTASGKRKASKASRRGNQSVTKLIMASFVVSEIVVSALVMPVALLETASGGRWVLGRSACAVWNFLNGFIFQVTVFHGCSLAVDRCLAIRHPLVYRGLTLRHGCVLAAAAWSIPVCISILFHSMGWYYDDTDNILACLEYNGMCGLVFNKTAYLVVFVIFYILPFLLTIYLYAVILLEVHRFHKRTKRYTSKETSSTKQDNASATNASNARHVAKSESPEIAEDETDAPKSEPKADSKNMKAYRTTACIVFCIFACWIPAYTMSSASVFNVSLISYSLQPFLYWVFTLHTAINPFILFFNGSVRHAVKALMSCNRRREIR